MAGAVAWVLNLDAEDELALGERYRGPGGAMAARIEARAAQLSALVGDQDGARSGRAWCPTPWALAKMRARGLAPPRAPPFEVLRRVNHRAFSSSLGQTLPGAAWVASAAELAALLGGAGTWVLKRPLGFAGRERMILDAAAIPEPVERWIAASFAGGDGLQVEPWVDRAADFGLHGYVRDDGALVLGAPTVQVVDARGAWVSSERAPPGALEAGEARALEEEARRTAAALHEAGYAGAFGIDAFRWRACSGALAFQPRSEINARYSMGWAAGMGGFRPEPGEP